MAHRRKETPLRRGVAAGLIRGVLQARFVFHLFRDILGEDQDQPLIGVELGDAHQDRRGKDLAAGALGGHLYRADCGVAPFARGPNEPQKAPIFG